MPLKFAAPRLPRALLLAACLTSCSDCARDGCDLLTSRADDRGPGVAGVIAQQSDVSVDGCMECPFADASISIWETDSEVATDAAATDIVQSAEPLLTEAASRRFRLPLDPGRYLLCVRPNCVNIQVEATTVTANIKLRKGPVSFFIAQAASQPPTEALRLDVGF